MTPLDKAELLCSLTGFCDSLKHALNVNAFVLGDNLNKNVTICDFCHHCTKNKKTSCLVTSEEILRLSKNSGGRAIFFCGEGKIFISSPVIYDDTPVALLLAGPLKELAVSKLSFDYGEKKTNNISFKDISALWELSHLLFRISLSFSFPQNESINEDSLDILLNELLMLIRVKNIADFKNRLKEAVYTLGTAKPNGIFSAKAYALMFILLILKISLIENLDIKNIFGTDFKSISILKNAKYESEIETVLTELSEKFTQTLFGKTSARQLAICDAVNYIENHFKEKLTLERVASEIFMSPTYLSRAFLLETGMNFSDFLNKTRVEKAKELLSGSSASLNEIAKESGFHDQSYFSKVFKKICGITPKEYRITESLM